MRDHLLMLNASHFCPKTLRLHLSRIPWLDHVPSLNLLDRAGAFDRQRTVVARVWHMDFDVDEILPVTARARKKRDIKYCLGIENECQIACQKIGCLAAKIAAVEKKMAFAGGILNAVMRLGRMFQRAAMALGHGCPYLRDAPI